MKRKIFTIFVMLLPILSSAQTIEEIESAAAKEALIKCDTNKNNKINADEYSCYLDIKNRMMEDYSAQLDKKSDAQLKELKEKYGFSLDSI